MFNRLAWLLRQTASLLDDYRTWCSRSVPDIYLDEGEEEQVEVISQEYSWTRLKQTQKWWYWLLGIIEFSLIIFLIIRVYELGLPLVNHSIFTGLVALLTALFTPVFGREDLAGVFAVQLLLMLFIITSPSLKRQPQEQTTNQESDPRPEPVIFHTTAEVLLNSRFVKFLPRYAVEEEVLYRYGSEEWTWAQRVKACLLFGIVHVAMIFVPIHVALVLSLAGAFFMLEYQRVWWRTKDRHQALLAAANMHSIYNVYAVLLFFGWLCWFVGEIIWKVYIPFFSQFF